jgi:hypothetical protein
MKELERKVSAQQSESQRLFGELAWQKEEAERTRTMLLNRDMIIASLEDKLRAQQQASQAPINMSGM